MLRRLLKVANKIDKLGLTKEADLLDNIIKKMAAMGEGSPAWLEMDNPGAAGEDSELEMNDEGELNYPEQAQFEESMFGLGEDVDNIRGDWHDEEDADNWED